MAELDSQAANIPAYLEEDYRKAIVTALMNISKQEQQENIHHTPGREN